MMDTSETYIKMCDCGEIQGFRGRYKWQAWDYTYASWGEAKDVMVVSGYCTDSGFYGLEAGSEKYPDDECVPLDAIWLPRQDQLQEMVMQPRLLQRFFVWWDNLPLFPDYDSMEQLWLAFVMKEKGKTWDGDKWIHQKL
jgi:hypothetical protein